MTRIILDFREYESRSSTVSTVSTLNPPYGCDGGDVPACVPAHNFVFVFIHTTLLITPIVVLGKKAKSIRVTRTRWSMKIRLQIHVHAIYISGLLPIFSESDHTTSNELYDFVKPGEHYPAWTSCIDSGRE